MELKEINNHDFFSEIVEILKEARKTIQSTVDITMVVTNYKIGQKIVEEELHGKNRADYGKVFN